MIDKYSDCKYCCCSDCLNDCKECRDCNDGIDWLGSCKEYLPKEG